MSDVDMTFTLKRDMDAINCMQKPMKYFPNKTG